MECTHVMKLIIHLYLFLTINSNVNFIVQTPGVLYAIPIKLIDIKVGTLLTHGH